MRVCLSSFLSALIDKLPHHKNNVYNNGHNVMGSLNIPPKLSNDLKSLPFMTFVEQSLLLRCKDKAVYNQKLHLRCIIQMKESTPSLVIANQSQSSRHHPLPRDRNSIRNVYQYNSINKSVKNYYFLY